MTIGRVLRLAVISFLSVLALTTRTVYPQVPWAGRVDFPAPAVSATAGGYEPQILGVATHFGMVQLLGYVSGSSVSAQIKAIGANSYRDGIAWKSFHFSKGSTPNLWERRRIIDFLPVAGVRPLLVLSTFGGALAAHGMPFTGDQLGEFAAYVKATVAMTRQYDAIYEVWNEYNLRVENETPTGRLTGEGDPSDIRAAVHYAALANTGVRAVKEADPAAKVIVGAVGDDLDWRWTSAIVRYGALDGADGLSVHLYNHCDEVEMRNAPEMVARLEALQAMLKEQRGGQETPIYVSEFGWPTSETTCGVPPERTAYNFAQFILQSATLSWLRGAWIYELKDGANKPKDIESNFGVFTYDDGAKPAVCFIREARKIVADAKSVELRQPRPGVFVLHAIMADRQLAVVWTSDIKPRGRLELAGQARSAQYMCGQPADVRHAIAILQAPVVIEYGLDQASSMDLFDGVTAVATGDILKRD